MYLLWKGSQWKYCVTISETGSYTQACFTPYTLPTSCWLCTTNRTHTQNISTLPSFPGSNCCYCKLLSSMRNRGTRVFLLHIQDFPRRLFENLNEKSWLHKTHNYLEWEGQKSAFLFHSTLIHQIGVCHAFSLIGVQFVHGVSFNSGWLEFLDYLTLEAGTNRPCESVGIQLPVYTT